VSNLLYGISKSVLEEIAIDKSFPLPTDYLNSGAYGDVYHTTDPDMVCRFGYVDLDGEKEKLIKKLKNTGGVVKVFHQVTKSIKVNGYKKQVICSWKEKVVTGSSAINTHFKNKYGDDYYYDILHPLDTLMWDYNHPEITFFQKLEKFTKFPEFKSFIIALKKGLPRGDLSVYKNAGLNRNNQLVAFDC